MSVCGDENYFASIRPRKAAPTAQRLKSKTNANILQRAHKRVSVVFSLARCEKTQPPQPPQPRTKVSLGNSFVDSSFYPTRSSELLLPLHFRKNIGRQFLLSRKPGI